MKIYHNPNKEYSECVNIRKKILKIVHQSGASHIGSSFSVIDILFSIYNNTDIDKIKNGKEDRDRIILSKGHSVSALYVVLNNFNLLSDDDLNSYYKNGSILGGHVTHNVDAIEFSTGALGHGLSIGTGVCIGMKSKKIDAKTYVIVGDGELHEGSNWEALMLIGQLKLNNMCVIIDNNKLGGIGKTDSCCCLEPLKDKFESFGLEVFRVNGHNMEEINLAIQNFKKSDKPVAIICDTIKGKAISFMENNNAWHYRPPNSEEYNNAIEELCKLNEIK